MSLSAADDRLLTRRQAAEVLGLRPETLASWTWKGKEDRPPEVRIGDRAVRYRASDLSKWISAPRKPATTTRNPKT
jgi:hypothetical protein